MLGIYICKILCILNCVDKSKISLVHIMYARGGSVRELTAVSRNRATAAYLQGTN